MITLKDYLGFIFQEITDARIGLDYYVAHKAQEMSKDEVMKHFQVPRFRVPEMEVNIPVLISGAKYNSAIKFAFEKLEFEKFVLGTLQYYIQTIKIKLSKINKAPLPPGVIKPPIKIDIIRSINIKPIQNNEKVNLSNVVLMISEFFDKLETNPIPSYPDNIVTIYCENIFHQGLKEGQIKTETFGKDINLDELIDQFVATILIEIKEQTIVVSNSLKNLLVNPETQLIKENSNEFSVFQIKAKINEEGLKIHTIKNEEGESKIVEFD